MERVQAEVVVPRPGGVARAPLRLDGRSEFEPCEPTVLRLLGFSMHPRTWVSVKIRGKLVARKLVVPRHRGPELLSWLFATLASESPSCVWGEQRIARHTEHGRT